MSSNLVDELQLIKILQVIVRNIPDDPEFPNTELWDVSRELDCLYIQLYKTRYPARAEKSEYEQ